MKRAEVRFSGRVQGVGFRATVRDIARSFEVSGWVRNEADGTVYLVAEGVETELSRFLETVQSRMGRSISAMDRVDGPMVGEQGFEVRR